MVLVLLLLELIVLESAFHVQLNLVLYSIIISEEKLHPPSIPEPWIQDTKGLLLPIFVVFKSLSQRKMLSSEPL